MAESSGIGIANLVGLLEIIKIPRGRGVGTLTNICLEQVLELKGTPWLSCKKIHRGVERREWQVSA